MISTAAHESVLVSKDPKDRALGHAGRVRNLARGHCGAVLHQQRHDRGHDGGPTLIGRQSGGATVAHGDVQTNVERHSGDPI
jgi:hypothetical protein